jgi:hypothetical protein
LIRGIFALIPSLGHVLNTKKLAAFLSLLLVLFYLFVSGLQIPAIRSFIMIAVILLAVMLDRSAISLRTAVLAGIFILEQIYLNREKYDFMKSFNENVLQILGNKEVIKFSAQDLEQIITRYKVQEDCGKFREMLEEAIGFFKRIDENN